MRITLTPRAEFDRPAYAVPRAPFPIDLRLDGNEGQAPDTALLDAFRQCSSASIRQYPSSLALERAIAARYRLAPEQVLITAGGDDAIQRICRAFLGPTRSIVLPVPTFEMIGRFARWEESEILPVPWESPRYPVNEVLKAVQADTTVIAMVSPNNPTGGWATVDDLREVAQAAPGALVMVDAAYAEFGDVDLTETALELPNTLVLRTFSKAYGLAGLRIGYVMGEARWVRALRAAGLPYPVSQPSIALALRALEGGEGRRDYTDRVAAERPMLAERLRAAGWKVSPSQGNFVFARGGDSLWLRDAMAAMGIGIRAWPKDDLLGNCVRITCPGNATEFTRLDTTLQTVLAPKALLFDMDGVLADVSRSYRLAIVQTAEHFGVAVGLSDIDKIKAAGDANNDWIVTQRLLEQAGVRVSLESVRNVFNGLYGGTQARAGLSQNEQLIGSREQLVSLASRYRLGVVTGRPRAEALAFLERFELAELFAVVITMEDAPAKPSPEPVALALEKLGVNQAWMIGDTPDDIRAARAAGVLPLGVCAPGANEARALEVLTAAGAARTWPMWSRIMEVLG